MTDLDTTDGNSWTVAVFKCQRKNWTETLSSFFSELDKQEQSLIPHFTIRRVEPSTNSLIISLRILRKQKDEEAIKSLIQKLLMNNTYEIDPKNSSLFSKNDHAWISHGERKEHWTMERCKILSKLSRFALEIINSNTSLEDRLEWTHLFSNMITIFDHEKTFRSPEAFPNIYHVKYHHS